MTYVSKVLLASNAIPVVPNIAGRKPQFDKAAGAAPAAPKAAALPPPQAVPIAPAETAAPPLPPADHAPVLLQVGTDPVRLRQAADATRSVTPAVDVAPALPATPPVIVF